MDVANELLDAIEIIVDKKIRENTAQIYLGVCKSISGNGCVMSINGRNNTVQFYGSAPNVGATYRVFVPCGNMSMAFVITGNDDRKGVYYSNPNLLDNPNFAVNQRRTTSVPGAPVAYIVDRWKTYGYSAATVSVLENGHISISGGGASAGSSILQYLEKPLPAGTYTLSVKVSRCENPNSSGNFGAIYMRKGTKSVKSAYINGPGINSLTFTVSDGEVDCASFGCLSNSTVEFEYVKLELGSQQTLAHQDADGNWVLNEIPDYGEQLIRCQRYFQTFATESLRPTDVLDFRPVMRTNPALSTIAIGGKTLYTASADL